MGGVRRADRDDVLPGAVGRGRSRRAADEGRHRQFARIARRAVGRQRDLEPDHRVAGRGPRHHALCRLPLSSDGALRRHRKPARHAGGLRLGDADGATRYSRHPVRLRRRVLAANGLRHRVDEFRVAVGGEPARRRRSRHLLRHRAAAVGNRGPACDRAIEDAAALERRRNRRNRRRLGGERAAP
jgi:hypothetical protein